MSLINAWEECQIPVNLFKGEVFCSRYGVHVDRYRDPEGNKNLFDIMYLLDGTRTMSAIAETLGVPLEVVERTARQLQYKGLVDLPRSSERHFS